MRIKRLAAAGAFILSTTCLFAQGLNTTATKDDWEEINFEFNSSILSDGYPSLLRLAELLSQHRDYRVTVVGHTDYVGSNAYNQKLSIARANTVRDFLVKYGAAANQIAVNGEGKTRPQVDNKTKEGRFINRRVSMTVTDGQGRVVGSGGVGEAIHGFDELLKKQEECCSSILKRLDKLDEILAALRDLKGENDRLKSDLAELRSAQGALRDQVNNLPKPLTSEQTTQIAQNEGTRVLEEAQRRNKKFTLLGLNVGPTMGAGRTGDFTFSGRGQYFSPFGGSGMNAVQAQGEYMYYPGRQEGQFDIGLIHRFDRVQAGLFSSFKYLNFSEYQQAGGLGQGAFTLDYLFSRGRVGLFATKGFKNEAVLGRKALGPGSFLETYARIVDQIGGSTQVGAWGDAYFEGNIGYLKRRGGEDRPGGMIRLVQPLNERLAFTVEAGLNETLLNTKDSGRLVFGLQFGNWMRPKETLDVKHPVPVDIPRVRYELLTRRIGNSPPVADAGPDQMGVPAGSITLDGSASYDPEGDPLTYQWTQLLGPNVSLSGATSAKATFTAAAGTTYVFRLTVKDPGGLQSSARVTVSTAKPVLVRIIRFVAQPASIQPGGRAQLQWVVEGAEQVTVTPGPGRVDPASGMLDVTPAQTTEYTLTATAGDQTIRANATVTVQTPTAGDPRIVRFEATPTNITAGEASTLSWTTEGATDVSISGIGTVPTSGSRTVSPTETTTYTLTARSSDGRSVSAPLIVTVGAPGTGGAPRIIRFSGSPTEVGPLEAVSLCYQVENATSVSLSPGSINSTDFSGCSTVNPSTTTTYVLTATNAQGTTTASTVISVAPQVRILTFTANPQASTAGANVTLSWTTENATSVTITGNGAPSGNQPVNGSAVVKPGADTTYTLIAYGKRSQVSAVVLVRVGATTGIGGPVADAGPNQSVYVPFADLNGSASKDPNGGPLTFSWRVAGLKPADFITGASTATPRVKLNGSYGEYIFELTVTDKNGQRATATTKVNFVDP